MLPKVWETDRLSVSDSQLTEVSRLREVFNACSYVGKWDEAFQEETEEGIAKWVSKSLVPYAESKRLFQMQSIRRKDEPQIIGYYHFHYGVPRPEIALISLFVIHPDFHSRHFGSEAVAGLSQQMCGHKVIWLSVYLKNWPALRFWISAGFNTIIEYHGDKIHLETAYASLTLEKKLAHPQ